MIVEMFIHRCLLLNSKFPVTALTSIIFMTQFKLYLEYNMYGDIVMELEIVPTCKVKKNNKKIEKNSTFALLQTLLMLVFLEVRLQH